MLNPGVWVCAYNNGATMVAMQHYGAAVVVQTAAYAADNACVSCLSLSSRVL